MLRVRSCGPTLAATSLVRSTMSMRPVRRNTRCSPCCCCARPMRPYSGVLPSSAVMQRRLASHMWPLRKPPTMQVRKRSSASFSISSLESGAASCFPTVRTISLAFSTSGPLARLRADLGALGIERAEGQVEPEDHAAALCEIMAALTGGQFAIAERAQQQFFEKHLAPWIGRFFADLERAEAADFYRHAGTVGRLFMDIETEAFALPARADALDDRRTRR
jgi:Nitrate reductase delta subunit